MPEVETRAEGGTVAFSEAPTAGMVDPGEGDDHTDVDLRDRIHEVRLEVEKVRTEMGEMKAELCDRISVEVGKVRAEIGEMKAELVDRIGGVEKNLRSEIRQDLAELKRGLQGWLAFGLSLITVLITLVAVLG